MVKYMLRKLCEICGLDEKVHKLIMWMNIKENKIWINSIK